MQNQFTFSLQCSSLFIFKGILCEMLKMLLEDFEREAGLVHRAILIPLLPSQNMHCVYNVGNAA